MLRVLTLIGVCLSGIFASVSNPVVQCDNGLDMDRAQNNARDPKQVEFHPNPLPGLKVSSSSPTTITLEWPALFGGTQYTVYYIDDRMACGSASVGKDIKGNPSDDGTPMTATIENLDADVPYNLYVRVQRDNAENDFLAIFKSVAVPVNRQ